MYSKSKWSMYKALNMTDIKPIGLRDKLYDKSVLKYLDNYFRVKFIEKKITVPVYINVHWEIIHSKLNYMTDEEIELLSSTQE